MLLSLVKSLDARQFRACVACLHGGGRLEDEVRKLGIPFYAFDSRNPFLFIVKFRRIIQKEKIDLLQTHGARAELVGAWAAHIAGVRLVVSTLHDLYGFSSRAKILTNRSVNPFISRYISVTRAGYELAIKNFGIVRTRIQVIENGIDAAELRQKQDVAGLRRQLGIDDKESLIITVANLRPVKGHIHVLRAIGLMTAEERSGLTFCFVGADLSGGFLQRTAREMGVAGHILFAGFQENISVYLQAADMFLLPSESEGMPMAMLEAMAVGCPVIATDVGGVAEVIEDQQTGLLIPSRSPAAIKDAVLKLSDGSLKSRLRTNAGKAINSRFSIERMVQEYQDLYRQLNEAVLTTDDNRFCEHQ